MVYFLFFNFLVLSIYRLFWVTISYCYPYVSRPSVFWSLEFGVGISHDFMRMNFGGNKLMQRKTLTPQLVKEMQKNFVCMSPPPPAPPPPRVYPRVYVRLCVCPPRVYFCVYVHPYTEGHTHGGETHTRVNIHTGYIWGGTNTRRNIHTGGVEGHTRGVTYTWKDTHTEGHTNRGILTDKHTHKSTHGNAEEFCIYLSVCMSPPPPPLPPRVCTPVCMFVFVYVVMG